MDLFCPIRKELVAALPEERVRQRMLHLMLEEYGYPPGLVAVEKSLRQLPHLTPADQPLIPNRRADIVCFAKGVHPQFDLYPLLIVECKAVKLTQKVIGQITGYNHFVRAYFIAIANEEEIRIGWNDPNRDGYSFVPYLPSYTELIRAVKTIV